MYKIFRNIMKYIGVYKIVDPVTTFSYRHSYFASSVELDFPDLEEEVVTKLSNRVILFNDEWHTFDEVIQQIIKATGCSTEKAEVLTLEVHNTGKSMVYEGDMIDCLRVSTILEEIALRTQIEF
jgi:ATP-dependent Clp protease adaptor protein ClpS